MNPKEILDQLIDRIKFRLARSRRLEDRPGALVETLSKEQREELSKLKSSDLEEETLNYEEWRGIVQNEESFQLEEQRQERLAFDRRMNESFSESIAEEIDQQVKIE